MAGVGPGFHYLVETIYKAVDQTSATLRSIAKAAGQASTATGAMNERLGVLNKQFETVSGTSNAATAGVERFGVASGTAGAGQGRLAARTAEANAALRQQISMFAAIGAFAGGAAIVYGISQAAQLQRAMTGVAIATGVSGAAFEKLRTQVMDVSGTTAQSTVTIAQEMAMAAHSGLNDPQQLSAAFKQIAMFADVQWMSNKQDPVQAVKLASQFSHYFGAYSGKPLQDMLDDITRVMNQQPEALQKLTTQGRYFVPMASRLGIPEKTIMEYMALMGQTGFLAGKGGTGMAAVITRSLNPAALTAHLSKAQFSGLTDLGLLDKSGHLDKEFLLKGGAPNIDAIINQIAAERISKSSADPVRGLGTWGNDIKNAFQTQGQAIISVFASSISQERMKGIRARMEPGAKQLPGVMTAWDQFNQDFFLVFNKFVTNLQNLAVVIFGPTLPGLTKWFDSMAASIGNLVKFLSAHPDIDKIIAGTIAAATGFLALTAVFVGMNIGVRALEFGGIRFAGVTERLGLSFMTVIGPLGRVAGLVSSLSLGLPLLLVGLGLFFKANPAITNAISKWWQASLPKIAFAVGFGVGSVIRILVDGITQMFQTVAQSIVGLPGVMMSQLKAAWSDPRVWLDPSGAYAKMGGAFGADPGRMFAQFLSDSKSPFAQGVAAGGHAPQAGYGGDPTIRGHADDPFGRKEGGNIHIHGPVTVISHNPKDFVKQLYASARGTRGVRPALPYTWPNTNRPAGALGH